MEVHLELGVVSRSELDEDVKSGKRLERISEAIRLLIHLKVGVLNRVLSYSGLTMHREVSPDLKLGAELEPYTLCVLTMGSISMR